MLLVTTGVVFNTSRYSNTVGSTGVVVGGILLLGGDVLPVAGDLLAGTLLPTCCKNVTCTIIFLFFPFLF